MQTKNAIGNLINRYRAVLKKCNLLNTFGTLAIASAFAMSGAGLASAEVLSGSTATITTEEEAGNHGAAFDSDTDSLKVTGNTGMETSTITSVTGTLGTVLIDAATNNTDTILNVTDTQNNVVSDNITLKGNASNSATMNIVEGVSYTLLNAGNKNVITGDSTSVANQVLNIAGGLFSLSDTEIETFQSLDIGDGTNGVTVNVAESGHVVADVLTVDGDSELNALGKFDIVAQNGDIFVEDEGYTGVFAKQLVVTKGTVNADAINVIGGNTHDNMSAVNALDLTTDGILKTNTLNVKDATIGGDYTLVANGGITALEIAGASKVNGDVTVNGGALTAKEQPVADDDIKAAVINGTLTVSDGAVNIAADGDLEVEGGAVVSGGTVDVAGTMHALSSSDKALNQTGGDITVAQNGFFVADSTADTASSMAAASSATFTNEGVAVFADDLTIGNNSKVIAKTIKQLTNAYDSELTDSVVADNQGTLFIGNSKSVTLDGTGAVLGILGDLDVSTAPLIVTSGELAVKGTLSNQATATNVKIEANKYVHSGGDLTLAGELTVLQGIEGVTESNTVTTANRAELKLGVAESDIDLAEFFGEELMAAQGGTIAANLATNDAAIEVKGGDWTLADIDLGGSGGKLSVNGGNIIDSGDIASDGSDLEVLSGGLTAASIDFSNVSSNNGAITFGSTGKTTTVNVAGEVETGAADFTIAGDNENSTTVALGSLTLNGDMKVNGGTLTVGDASTGGAFDATGKGVTIGDTAKATVTLNGEVTTGDNSVLIGATGKLVAQYDKVVDSNQYKLASWGTLDTTSTGALTLTGASGSITLSDYKKLQDDIIGDDSKVALTIDGLEITITDSDDLSDAEGISMGEETIAAGTNPTLDDSTTTVKGLTSDTDVTVTVGRGTNSTQLTLTGGDEGFKLDGDGAGKVDIVVADNSTLQLGTGGAETRYGELKGSAQLSDGAALAVTGGEFSVAGITAEDSIGGEVTLNNGKLTVADGNVKVNTVTGTGDTAELAAANGNIDVTDAVSGSALTASAGNIDVTGAVSGSALTASAGNIDVTGAVSGSALTASAGTISVAGAVSSNSVLDADGDITTSSTVDSSSLTSLTGDINLGGAVSGTSSLSAVAGTINAGVNAVAAKDLEAVTFTSTDTVDLTGGNFNLTGTGSRIGGAFTADSMSGTVADITFDSTATIKNGSNLTFTNAVAGGGITVGDSLDTANGSTVTFGTLNLGTHTLKAESAFTASTPTSVAVGSFDDGSGNTDITGHIETGDNGLVSLGTTDTSILSNAVKGNAGGKNLGSSGYTSAMYIHAPVVLDSNGGLATGTTAGNGAVNIAANTLLVVNGQLSEAAISGVDATNSTFAGDVSILHAKQGDYTLFAGSNFTDSTLGKEKVYVDNRLLTVDENIVAADDGSDLKLTIVANTESGVLSNFSDNLGDLVLAYTEAGSGVNNFLDFALSNTNGLTDAQAAAVIEGAAKAPMIIGAPKIALNVATMGSDYAMARTSFAPRVAGAYAMDNNGQAQNIASGDNMANGMNVWIMPMYEHASVDGLDSGLYTLDYDTDFYGVAVGADYTWDNSFRLGATLNFGTGDAETKSGSSFSKTENDYDSLGVGLYAGYMFGNFGLSGDFIYTHVKNDIDQKVAGYGTLSAEGDTDVISLGLRAEYKYETAVMDIIPHAGIRYNHVDMDDMTFSGQLTTIADSANIWQLPVGVTFSREIATESGWNVKPSLDLSLIPAFGDTDMEQSVRFAGVNGLAIMNTEIMDELSGRAQVGIEASKDNFYMGLDYAYQGSSNIDAHQIQANFGFKF